VEEDLVGFDTCQDFDKELRAANKSKPVDD
jgi:hypothetical protein